MLFFGHIGISVILVKGVENTVKFSRRKIARAESFIDYRVVAFGALLPDIIDKPMVQLLYGLENHRGHFMAHTFIFSIMLICFGICFNVIKRNNSFIILGSCNLLHCLLDMLIIGPYENLYLIFSKIFFVLPKKLDFLHQFTAPLYDRIPYLKSVETYLLTPYVYIFELIGFGIIVYFGVQLLFRKRIYEFLKTGKL